MQFLLWWFYEVSFSCATLGSLKPREGKSFKVDGATYSKLWKLANKVVAEQHSFTEAIKFTFPLLQNINFSKTGWRMQVMNIFY